MPQRSSGRTELVSFHVTPAIKLKLEERARRDHRTVSALMRVLVSRAIRGRALRAGERDESGADR